MMRQKALSSFTDAAAQAKRIKFPQERWDEAVNALMGEVFNRFSSAIKHDIIFFKLEIDFPLSVIFPPLLRG